MAGIDGRSYNGKIYESDYDMTYKSLRYVADRIAGDMRFDQQCQRAAEQRDKLEKGFYRKNQNTKSEE